MRLSVVTAGAVAALALVSAPEQAMSQGIGAADANTLDEVVVTARKREEAARDVPFAVSVIGAEDLALRRIDDTLTLFRQVPGLALTTFDDGRFAYFQLRGIGPLTQALSPDDGSVVTYVDGVPQPVYASEFAYLDLARLEVLKGPQGTLYGRNAQAGAINITTRQPTDVFRADIRAEAGDDEYGLVQASASGPIRADRLYGSLTARASAIDGHVPNIAPRGGELGDRESLAARGTLVSRPRGVDGLRLALTLNGDRQISRPFYYALRDASDDPVVELDPENKVVRSAWGASLTIEAPLSFGVLTSVSAVNGFDNRQITDDTDGLIYGPLFGGLPSAAFLPPLDFSNWTEEERRFYQEVRLNSLADAAVAWVVGATYFRSEFDVLLINRSTFSPFLNGDRDATQDISSYAAFGELTAPLGSERFQGTAGLRYSRDEKAIDARFTGVGFPGTVAAFREQQEADFDLLTGRVAVSFVATADANLYATVARGAKSGGFPRFTLNAALGNASAFYDESSTWANEAGLKSRILGGRGRLDAAFFYNDTSDEQLFILDFVSFQFLPANLDTRSYGVEVDGAIRLAPGLDIAAAAAWTEAEIRETGASGAQAGNRVPNVSRLSTTATLTYQGPEGAFGLGGVAPMLTLTHQYAGDRAVDVAESFELPGYHNVDLRAGVAVGAVEVYAFGRNLTDERPQLNGVLYGPGVEASAFGRGRTVGVGLSGRF